MKNIFVLGFVLLFGQLYGQANFDYRVELRPVQISGLGGLHSYAFAQHDGRWLVIGGRLDGLHARQPFNAFPQASNNTDILVIDPNTGQYWAQSLGSLSASLAEQLQATNMAFFQEGDSLYIVGGYAYSATAADHITFPKLTTVRVAGLMTAVVNGDSIAPYFKQVTDNNFAITGGQLGKLADTFYLVGGHRFDGRYNPMGNPTYTQTYSNQVRKFSVNNSAAQLAVQHYTAITDQVHLHRRDYNLLPQIFPDRSAGYTVSSGVFQIGVDLPFLYPVDISPLGITARTNFNQYLSNYHSAKACLYDSLSNQMHNLFFGGLSQYYYDNGTLIQDDNVPFVKTISRMTRLADGSLEEVAFANEMPNFKGAGAEFIPNHALPHYAHEAIKLHEITADSVLIGHIYGGILSPSLNPFTNNLTTTTMADTSIYAVWLIRQPNTAAERLTGGNPYQINILSNPMIGENIEISYHLPKSQDLYYMISDMSGQIILRASERQNAGEQRLQIALPKDAKSGLFVLSVVFEGKFFVSKIITKP